MCGEIVHVCMWWVCMCGADVCVYVADVRVEGWVCVCIKGGEWERDSMVEQDKKH